MATEELLTVTQEEKDWVRRESEYKYELHLQFMLDKKEEEGYEQAKREDEKIIQEKDSAIQEKDNAIQEKNSIIQEKNSIIQEKNSIIQEKNNAIQEKDHIIAELMRKMQGAD
ncbi:hypothetical protein AGMMS4952_21640 [Spirochaetia bacterium]|nr:hypothetical protein AGMMS4952_21640 [Spirochaetia bacterium]